MPIRSYLARARPVRLRTFLLIVTIVSIVAGLQADRIRRRLIAEALEGPILNAAERGDTATVRALLDRGADVDSITNGRYPWTPLMNAAFRGHLDAVRLLLDRGADIDHEDLDSFRAVTLAAAEGHWAIVRLLAARGADLSMGDGYGKTAFDYAREAGRNKLGSGRRTLAR